MPAVGFGIAPLQHYVVREDRVAGGVHLDAADPSIVVRGVESAADNKVVFYETVRWTVLEVNAVAQCADNRVPADDHPAAIPAVHPDAAARIGHETIFHDGIVTADFDGRAHIVPGADSREPAMGAQFERGHPDWHADDVPGVSPPRLSSSCLVLGSYWYNLLSASVSTPSL